MAQSSRSASPASPTSRCSTASTSTRTASGSSTAATRAAAANAADAYGKLTGRPGICMVTRGPGATHAATGVHTARQDSTPLILLVGQIARAERGRESFQELDYEAVFGSMAKWAFEIDDPARIPELLARAYSVATSGRPGPVVLALPEDVLSGTADVADVPRYQPLRPAPDPLALAELEARLLAAERPFVLVGGGPWDDGSARAFTRWALDCGLPVGATFRRQDVVDNTLRRLRRRRRSRDQPAARAAHPRLRPADRGRHAPGGDRDAGLHAARRRRSRRSRSCTCTPTRASSGASISRRSRCSAASREFAAAAPVVDGARWADWAADARADYEARPAPRARARDRRRPRRRDRSSARGAAARRDPHQRRRQLLRLGRTASTSGAEFGTQLGPQSGAMGYGIPAALAAQVAAPRPARWSRSPATATSRCAGRSSRPRCRRGCRSS